MIYYSYYGQMRHIRDIGHVKHNIHIGYIQNEINMELINLKLNILNKTIEKMLEIEILDSNSRKK